MRKALVVGIDDYPSGALSGCCNDAEQMQRLLAKNEDGTPNFNVRIEKNVQTKAALRRMVDECFSGNAEVALFYYSGHGYFDAIGGYLATPDFDFDDPGLSLQDLLTIANDSKCRNRIIILDSCHSGAMGNLKAIGQTTSLIEEGVTILTSSRLEETSLEVNGQGLFTSLLIDGLSGGAADITGHVTPGGIYAYIDKALGPWDQRPVFKTNVTNFVPIRKVTPQVDIATIRKISEYFSTENEHLQLDPSYEPTNSPNIEHDVIEPYANKENTEIFADLQKLESIGIVVPVGEDHMYFAAMNGKACRLTPIGKHYWRLVNKEFL